MRAALILCLRSVISFLVLLPLSVAGGAEFSGRLLAVASNERFLEDRPDFVERLKEAGMKDYCGWLAYFWDDGVWARSMGIARMIVPRAETDPEFFADPDDIPRDAIHHQSWARMNEHERAWYQDLAFAGWDAADSFIKLNPELLVHNPHDRSGVIPYEQRMLMKQGRFEECLRNWPPREI